MNNRIRRFLQGPFLPILGFATVLAVAACLRHVVGYTHPGYNFPEIRLEKPIDASFLTIDFSNRSLWTLSAAVLVLSLITVVIGSVLIIFQSTKRLLNFVIIILLTLLASMMVFGIAEHVQLPPRFCSELLGGLTFQNGNPIFIAENLTNLTFAVSTFMVIAASMVLYSAQQWKERPVDILSQKMRHLRLLLYMGAFLLISNTVSISALYRWPGILVESESLRHDVLGISTTISLTTGAIHTLLLVGFYLPASFLLTHKAYLLANNAGNNLDEVDIRTWLQNRNLISTPWPLLSRVLVALGPFIVGGMIPVLSALLKG